MALSCDSDGKLSLFPELSNSVSLSAEPGVYSGEITIEGDRKVNAVRHGFSNRGGYSIA